ncbi:MAG: hypothetical protein HY286_12365 [Planctomycetes bacterium]|nr:hypothetical protein [Planctomycetota bacterium]
MNDEPEIQMLKNLDGKDSNDNNRPLKMEESVWQRVERRAGRRKFIIRTFAIAAVMLLVVGVTFGAVAISSGKSLDEICHDVHAHLRAFHQFLYDMFH